MTGKTLDNDCAIGRQAPTWKHDYSLMNKTGEFNKLTGLGVAGSFDVAGGVHNATENGTKQGFLFFSSPNTQDTNNGKKEDDGYTHTRQGNAHAEAEHTEHDTPTAQLSSSSELSLSELMRNSAETSENPPNLTTDSRTWQEQLHAWQAGVGDMDHICFRSPTARHHPAKQAVAAELEQVIHDNTYRKMSVCVVSGKCKTQAAHVQHKLRRRRSSALPHHAQGSLEARRCTCAFLPWTYGRRRSGFRFFPCTLLAWKHNTAC